jgi:hypothetical protein
MTTLSANWLSPSRRISNSERGRPEMTATDKNAAVADDPIFEAIDVHRAAWRAQLATMELVDTALARQQGRTVTPADVEANELADRLERKAITGHPTENRWGGFRAALFLKALVLSRWRGLASSITEASSHSPAAAFAISAALRRQH